MIGPSIDSGLVCTLTALAILIGSALDPAIVPAGSGMGSMEGLRYALNAFQAAIPGVGNYLLFAIVILFAFSTMFSYSYYGQKCTGFLFGARYAKYYNYFFLAMLVYQHTIISPKDLSRLNAAFFTANGIASLVFCVLVYLSGVKCSKLQFLHPHCFDPYGKVDQILNVLFF